MAKLKLVGTFEDFVTTASQVRRTEPAWVRWPTVLCDEVKEVLRRNDAVLAKVPLTAMVKRARDVHGVADCTRNTMIIYVVNGLGRKSWTAVK